MLRPTHIGPLVGLTPVAAGLASTRPVPYLDARLEPEVTSAIVHAVRGRGVG